MPDLSGVSSEAPDSNGQSLKGTASPSTTQPAFEDSMPLTEPQATTAPTDLPIESKTVDETLAKAPSTNGHTTHGHSNGEFSSNKIQNVHTEAGYTTNTYTSQIPTNLTGKVALVTGASRGIGAGIALELGRRGASVVVNYVKGLDGANAMVQQIEEFGSKALAIQADVSKVPEITRLFEESKAHFGKIDIVCSNSGMESFDATEDITEERFDLVFGLNLRAQFFVGQHAYKYCEPNSRLILMSSIAAGLISVGNHALYSGSKSAVNGITKSFAKDFGKKGMTVNAIAPGGVKSDMFTQVAWKYIPGADGSWPAEKIENMMAHHCPLGRCALPQDVARVVAFLASEDGGWVNGGSGQ
ncbi:hypothetical protein P7C71_g2801, partial [Lecanoromycetidae sp. Uapishka_2]